MMETTEEVVPSVPVPVATVDNSEEMEHFSREQEATALQREIDSLPDSNPEKAKLQGELNRARMGAMPDKQAMAAVGQAADGEKAKQNEKEGQQIQQTLMNGAMAITGLGGIAQLAGLLGAHEKKAGEILFNNHQSATTLSAGLFQDDDRHVMIRSAEPRHLFTPEVTPGTRVAALQPVREIGAGASPGLPPRTP